MFAGPELVGELKMPEEFRRFHRKNLAVKFKADGDESLGSLYFESGDVSLGGAFLKSDVLLEEGEELLLEFIVPVRGQVKTRGKVTWVKRFPEKDQPAGMGVEFQDLSEADRSALAAWIKST